MQLVWPAPEYLRSYCEALARGWSPNNLRPEVAQEELAAIRQDPDAYFAAIVNFQGGGSGVVISPDGYALTNFHVTAPTGPAMKCGLADGASGAP